jgi:hypothetical protein
MLLVGLVVAYLLLPAGNAAHAQQGTIKSLPIPASSTSRSSFSTLSCTSDQEQAKTDLGIPEITSSNGTASATITNRSTTRAYTVGLIILQINGPNNAQSVEDYKEASLAPGASVTLTVTAPDCEWQADTYFGPIMTLGACNVLSGILGGQGQCQQLGDVCPRTKEYWKDHPDAWISPIVTIGTNNYNQTQLLQILNQPINNNGLVALVQELIATRLNLPANDTVQGYIVSADALVGSMVVPPIGSGSLTMAQTSTLTAKLHSFNITQPEDCKDVPPPDPCTDCKGGVTKLVLKFLGSNGSSVKIKDGYNTIFGTQTVNNGQIITLEGSESDGRFDNAYLDFYISGCQVGSLEVTCLGEIIPGTTDQSQTKGRTRSNNNRADFEVVSAISRDGGKVCVPDEPPPSCSDCKGGVTKLVLKFKGSDNSWVKVKDGDKVVFGSAQLDNGQNFTVMGWTSDGTFKQYYLDFYVSGCRVGSLEVNCADVITPGTTDQSQTKGRQRYSNNRTDVEVVESISRDGGIVCVPEEPPTACSVCKGGVTKLALKFKGTSGSWVKVKDGYNTIFGPTKLNNGQVITLMGTESDGTFHNDYLDFYISGCRVGSLEVTCAGVIVPGTTDETQSKGKYRYSNNRTEFEIVQAISRDGGEVCPTTPPPSNCSSCSGGATKLSLKFLGDDNSWLTVVDGSKIIFGPKQVDQDQIITLMGWESDGTFGADYLDFYIGYCRVGSLEVSCDGVLTPGTTDQTQTKGRYRTNNYRSDVKIIDAYSKNGGRVCPEDDGSGIH